MDFKGIEYVCAIYEAKTISQAAKSLFISQPALSQYLAKLEQELGTTLFERAGSAMIPTTAAEILVRDGRALLNARQEMLGQVNSLTQTHKETLRFGISPFYSKYYLPLLLPYYREHHPNVHLSIVEQTSTELEQQVLDGTLDLCFIPAEPMREGLTYRPIYMEEIMIAVPPTHSINAMVIPSAGRSYLDICGEPFVDLVPSLKFSKMSRKILRHFSLSPQIIYESTSWETVCMLVAQGIGVGFLPKVLIHKHLCEPNFYHIAGIDSTRCYAAVYAQGTHLSNLAQILISEFQKLLEHMG